MDLIEVCRQFIAVESTPTTGNALVAKLAGEYCEKLGLKVSYQEGVIAGVAQMNVIARPADRPEEEILLQTHLDTAEAGAYSLWTETDRNPFNATIRDGKIYGLGAANSKLDYVCKLMALREIGKKDWKTPFVLVGTFGEESGMLGAKKLIQSKALTAKKAIVGEPTNLRLATACNGIAVLDFFIPFNEEEKAYRSSHADAESTATHSRIFRGKAAHSAHPELGENAITKAIRYLEELPDTIAILTIDGGTYHNIVPDQAFVEVDISTALKQSAGRRLLSIYKELENLATEFIRFSEKDLVPPTPTLNYGVVRTYEDGIQLIVSLRMTPSVRDRDLQLWRSRIREFCQSINARFRLRDFKLSWRSSDGNPLVEAAKSTLSSLGLNSKDISKCTTNESSVYFQEGLDCIVFGPGWNEGNSHGPNEFVKVDDLHLAVQFYKKFIERVCL